HVRAHAKGASTPHEPVAASDRCRRPRRPCHPSDPVRSGAPGPRPPQSARANSAPLPPSRRCDAGARAVGWGHWHTRPASGDRMRWLLLLLSRPFQVGDVILLRSGALSGQLEGTVTEIGLPTCGSAPAIT